MQNNVSKIYLFRNMGLCRKPAGLHIMIEMIYPIKSKKTIRIIIISLKNCAKRTVKFAYVT